jgi:GAF domain-containing protein
MIQFIIGASVDELKPSATLSPKFIDSERLTGLIYLDSSSPWKVLDEGHLQLLTAVGSIAAVAIENVQHLEWLEGENQRLNREINLAHNMIGESPRMREVYQFTKESHPRMRRS